MKNIPASLQGYKLQVSECPEMKMRKDENGKDVVVTQDGVTKFVVGLFAKKVIAPGERREKGEEIRVTLDTDPGEDISEGALVELIDLRISPYSFKNDKNETVSGVSFSAAGVKPVH